MAHDPVLAHCRAMLRSGSRSFFRAAALLPARAHHGACLLYAWCRHCDDAVDHQTLGRLRPGPPATAEQQGAILADLRRATSRAVEGQPTDEPVFLALQRVVHDFRVPGSLPHLLLDGMAMDVEGRRYQTVGELEIYCYHVAGVVGAMMAHVMGSPDPESVRLAADLGIAFQLTNIARDVLDDAAQGRVYLPLQWLAEAGVPEGEITHPARRWAVAGVVLRVLDRADCFYRRADAGLAHLPFRAAWAVAAARGIYAHIGTLIRRRGAYAWDRRAVVSPGRQLLAAGRGLWQAGSR